MSATAVARRTIVTAAAIVVLAVPTVAFASHVFSDVADDAIHAPGIEYVADAGITAGCTATTYCPDEEVTRAQMGTFLHRSSGNAPGIAPSVNAAQLDGQTADDLLSDVDASTIDGVGLTSLITGAVHVRRGPGDAPVVAKAVNNVGNGAATVTGADGVYTVDPGFDASASFVTCTIDQNHVDSRDASCSVYTHPSGTLFVEVYDASVTGPAAGEFYLVLVGMG